jgi:hypothetical protein
MNRNIDELLVRIHALQDELEDEYRRAREEWAERKLELAEELQRQQRVRRLVSAAHAVGSVG